MSVAGIYIHIPFCRKACHYCNFHFSTSFKLKDQLIDAIIQEIEIRNNAKQFSNLESIYLGGGTPSLLSYDELSRIFEALSKYYNWDSKTEITLEANPEDVNLAYLNEIKTLGINRLSVGIQSFNGARPLSYESWSLSS